MKLLYYPNTFLNKNLKKVKKFDINFLTKLKKEMFKIAKNNNGIGLAASQIGINKRLFIILIEDKADLYINPEILEFKNQHISIEGCLSIPEYKAEILRYNNIKIKAYNEFQKLITKDLIGLEAVVFQHELDHLNGILINKNEIK